MVQFKVEEIKDHARDYLINALKYNPYYIDENDINDIHHDIFNTDYYIIGRYDALQWCQNMQTLLLIVDSIKCYEEDNFGEITTDLSEPENIVNMYVYMIGEEILEEVIEEVEGLQVVKLNKEILKGRKLYPPCDITQQKKQNKTQKESK